MTLKEYALSIYSKIKLAKSTDDVEKIFDQAIGIIKKQNFSDMQIEEFKEFLREQAFYLKEAQENEQTLKNQQKAMALLKKD